MLGACVLIFRAYSMLAEGARDRLVSWVYALIVAELVLDIAALMAIAAGSSYMLHLRPDPCIALYSPRRDPSRSTCGNIRARAHRSPWIDFNVLPAARAEHADRWTWGRRLACLGPVHCLSRRSDLVLAEALSVDLTRRLPRWP